MIVSLAFADTESAGFSPIITPALYEGKASYRFVLNNTSYIYTGTMLSEFRARRCKGRGTRVLTVKQENEPNSPTYALKYYWMVQGNTFEWNLLESIREKAAKRGLDPNVFLLTTKAFGEMLWHRNGSPFPTLDTTKNFIRGSEEATSFYPPSNPSFANAILNPDPFTQGAGEVPAIRSGDPLIDQGYTKHKNNLYVPSLKYIHRQHVFLLFNEVGIALHDIQSTSTFFLALREGVKGTRFTISLYSLFII